nr:MAG: structural polyprotein [Xinjiang sediment hepe-like virus 1]
MSPRQNRMRQRAQTSKRPTRVRRTQMKPRPRTRPTRQKVASRPNYRGANNPMSKLNVNAPLKIQTTERVVTLTIPVDSKPGDLLYVLKNNPTSSPRARVITSQHDSWHGDTHVEVETTGNAFAKNFLLIRHVPNGDESRLPTPGQDLLNFAEAYSRKGETCKLQLDSNAKGRVSAPWRLTSYNPNKPILDSDPSECNNGLYIIVSNGSPGAEPVDITIRFHVNISCYGAIYKPIEVVNPSSFNTRYTPTFQSATQVLHPSFGPAPVSTGERVTLAPLMICDQPANIIRIVPAGTTVNLTTTAGPNTSFICRVTGPDIPANFFIAHRAFNGNIEYLWNNNFTTFQFVS